VCEREKVNVGVGVDDVDGGEEDDDDNLRLPS